MVIYLDVLLLENLVLDYLVLFAAARLSGEVLPRWRLLLAAALGAAYAAAVYLPGMEFLSALPFKLCVGLLMALISFGGRKRLLRNTLVFFFTSFAFGGCALAVGLLTGGAVMQNGAFLPVSLKSVAISLLLSFGVLTPVFGRLARHGGLRRDTAKCVVCWRGRQAELTALLDTGNTLRDPLSGAPVIVAEAECLRPLLGDEACRILETQDAPSALERLPELGLRLIPCRSVGCACGFLAAFRPERVVMNGKVWKDAMMAVSPQSLSDGGAYTALAGVE